MHWHAYLSVFFLSSVKFLVGMLAAFAPQLQFGFWETFLVPTLGAFCGGIFILYFGRFLQVFWQRFVRKNRPAKQRSFAYRRRIHRFWSRFGIVGVGVVLPFISPPVGIAISLAFREHPKRIIVMLVCSLVVWGLVFASLKSWILQLL